MIFSGKHFLIVRTFPAFSLKSKFGIKRISSLFYCDFQKDEVNPGLNMTFKTNKADNKDIKSRRKFCRQSIF